MNARDLNRYKRLLLVKQRELSVNRAVLPAAGGAQGDLIDEANLDAEAELQIKVRETDVRLLRAIEEALIRIRQGTLGNCEVCRRPISEPAWKPFPGRASVAIARNASRLDLLKSRRTTARFQGVKRLWHPHGIVRKLWGGMGMSKIIVRDPSKASSRSLGSGFPSIRSKMSDCAWGLSLNFPSPLVASQSGPSRFAQSRLWAGTYCAVPETFPATELRLE